MRVAHWYALAAGERSSEELVTGAARWRSRLAGVGTGRLEPQRMEGQGLTLDARGAVKRRIHAPSLHQDRQFIAGGGSGQPPIWPFVLFFTKYFVPEVASGWRVARSVNWRSELRKCVTAGVENFGTVLVGTVLSVEPQVNIGRIDAENCGTNAQFDASKGVAIGNWDSRTSQFLAISEFFNYRE